MTQHIGCEQEKRKKQKKMLRSRNEKGQKYHLHKYHFHKYHLHKYQQSLRGGGVDSGVSFHIPTHLVIGFRGQSSEALQLCLIWTDKAEMW
jgi:hypothetical protein